MTELYTVLEEEKEVQYKRSYLYFGCRSRYWSKAIKTLKREKIGIYQGQVWHTDMAIKAEFDVARLHELNRPNITLESPLSSWASAMRAVSAQ